MTEPGSSYWPPVDQLVRLGDPRAAGPAWADYCALGLSREHVPELIRLATDEALHTAEAETAAVWAPLHAWRALAQLEAAEAAAPLLGIANFLERQQDDWFLEDLPKVFARFGPAAVEVLARFLTDADNGLYARITAARGLCSIGQRHPDVRARVVECLGAQLARCGESDPALNAFLVRDLLRLGAVEAAEVIERAFAAGRVDEGVVGSWDDVRAELGVPGLGLVTAQSPRNPNSLRDLRSRLLSADAPRSYAEVVRSERRERRRHRRRRR